MKKDTIRKFKRLFEMQRDALLLNNRSIICEEFKVCPDDRYDEVDQATTDIEQSMRMRLKNREALYMKKIDEALRRIDEGTFGQCEECDEDIEVKRLEARPTATLCVFCKEEQEKQEILTAAGREYKSLGAEFSRKYA